ncbi:UNVERIFIED_CONTAM: hypothetical protein HDU68_011938 [Siphonaria sp. JEL0065]|nr:hypothetical protein HDU68_011938 [Siphonaria sp. JEL0065]
MATSVSPIEPLLIGGFPTTKEKEDEESDDQSEAFEDAVANQVQQNESTHSLNSNDALDAAHFNELRNRKRLLDERNRRIRTQLLMRDSMDQIPDQLHSTRSSVAQSSGQKPIANRQTLAIKEDPATLKRVGKSPRMSRFQNSILRKQHPSSASLQSINAQSRSGSTPYMAISQENISHQRHSPQRDEYDDSNYRHAPVHQTPQLPYRLPSNHEIQHKYIQQQQRPPPTPRQSEQQYSSRRSVNQDGKTLYQPNNMYKNTTSPSVASSTRILADANRYHQHSLESLSQSSSPVSYPQYQYQQHHQQYQYHQSSDNTPPLAPRSMSSGNMVYNVLVHDDEVVQQYNPQQGRFLPPPLPLPYIDTRRRTGGYITPSDDDRTSYHPNSHTTPYIQQQQQPYQQQHLHQQHHMQQLEDIYYGQLENQDELPNQQRIYSSSGVLGQELLLGDEAGGSGDMMDGQTTAVYYDDVVNSEVVMPEEEPVNWVVVQNEQNGLLLVMDATSGAGNHGSINGGSTDNNANQLYGNIIERSVGGGGADPMRYLNVVETEPNAYQYIPSSSPLNTASNLPTSRIPYIQRQNNNPRQQLMKIPTNSHPTASLIKKQPASVMQRHHLSHLMTPSGNNSIIPASSPTAATGSSAVGSPFPATVFTRIWRKVKAFSVYTLLLVLALYLKDRDAFLRYAKKAQKMILAYTVLFFGNGVGGRNVDLSLGSVLGVVVKGVAEALGAGVVEVGRRLGYTVVVEKSVAGT